MTINFLEILGLKKKSDAHASKITSLVQELMPAHLRRPDAEIEKMLAKSALDTEIAAIKLKARDDGRS